MSDPYDDGAAPDTAAILQEMARTFRERNSQYRDNWRVVPEVIKAFFPEGVPADLITDPRWHLFELMIVKLTRYTQTKFEHDDSIHDAAIYAAMMEAIGHE